MFLITVKNRQLSTVPLNRVRQWTVNSTTAAFGSESVMISVMPNFLHHQRSTFVFKNKIAQQCQPRVEAWQAFLPHISLDYIWRGATSPSPGFDQGPGHFGCLNHYPNHNPRNPNPITQANPNLPPAGQWQAPTVLAALCWHQKSWSLGFGPMLTLALALTLTLGLTLTLTLANPDPS